MSDLKLLEEIMFSVESASYLTQKVTNEKLRSHVDKVLRNAYDIIQIEIASCLDDVPYV